MASTEIRALGYVRVSTEQQRDSGLGMDAQVAAITQAAERRGWELVDVLKDNGSSGTTTDGRPGLQELLERIEPGQVLLVAKLDRLSRSVQDAARILDLAASEGWYVVAEDVGMDTSTPAGRLVATVLAAVSEWEASVISERTSAALQAKKDAGATLGNPNRVPDETVRRIKRWRSRGWSLPKIAGKLNADKVPTAHGGAAWHPSTVRYVLQRTRGRKVGAPR